MGVQIEAIFNVKELDGVGRMRALCRWYSKRFYTPLHEVFNLPMEDVSLAFWEEHYDSLDDGQKRVFEDQYLSSEHFNPYEEETARIVHEQAAKKAAEEISSALDDILQLHKDNQQSEPIKNGEEIEGFSELEDLQTEVRF